MSARVQCPNVDCGTSVEVRDAVAGDTVHCPDCDTSITIPDSSLIGTTLGGDFKLVRSIAKGGMGEVYEAVQVSLDRTVALKILDGNLANNESFIQRFEREAKSAAALNHPSIVQVYQFGKDNDLHFLVMEYVDGRDLSKLVSNLPDRRFPRKDAIRIVRDVALALREAHSMGVIHRDIKPANILMDPKGRVKVSDLGLAKKVDDDVELTQTGVGIGSPHFIAPEQADDARHADHRADIYSLGITLLFLLTGRRPYDGTSAFSVVLAHANKKLPTCTELGLALSPDDQVELVIQKMAHKDPDRRYQTYEPLIRDLEALLAGLPIGSDEDDATMVATQPMHHASDDFGESQTFVEHDQSRMPPKALFDEQKKKAMDHETAEIRKNGTIMMITGIVLAVFSVMAAIFIPPLLSGREKDTEEPTPQENQNRGPTIVAPSRQAGPGRSGPAMLNQPMGPGPFNATPSDVEAAMQKLPSWIRLPRPVRPMHYLLEADDPKEHLEMVRSYRKQNPDKPVQNMLNLWELQEKNLPNDLRNEVVSELQAQRSAFDADVDLAIALFDSQMREMIEEGEYEKIANLWTDFPANLLSPDVLTKVASQISSSLPKTLPEKSSSSPQGPRPPL